MIEDSYDIHSEDYGHRIGLLHIDWMVDSDEFDWEIRSMSRVEALELCHGHACRVVLFNTFNMSRHDLFMLMQMCHTFGYLGNDYEHLVCIQMVNDELSYDAARLFFKESGTEACCVANACGETEFLPAEFYDEVELVLTPGSVSVPRRWILAKALTKEQRENLMKLVVGACVSKLVWCVSKLDRGETEGRKRDACHEMACAYGKMTMNELIGQWFDVSECDVSVCSQLDTATTIDCIDMLDAGDAREMKLLMDATSLVESACMDRMKFGAPEFLNPDEYKAKLDDVRELMRETLIDGQIELLVSGVPLDDILA